MGYRTKWNGYTGRRLADEAILAAVSGKRAAYRVGASDTPQDKALMALGFAQRFDEIEQLLNSLRDLMASGEGGTG